MFRSNKRHLRGNLFGDITSLTEKARTDLEHSWTGAFYREFFCRLDEQPFAVLYSDKASRPNAPVNILVGLEVLKSGFGWSDAELYDHFCLPTSSPPTPIRPPTRCSSGSSRSNSISSSRK